MVSRQTERLRGPAVSQLIGLLAEAYGRPALEILDEIARMAAGPAGEDSDPTRETILSYLKEPKAVAAGRKEARRGNSQTVLHHKFANLVINYLDGRRPDNQHVEVPLALANSNEWRHARRLCKSVLKAEREKRFEITLGSDPGAHAAIGSFCGLFATCRRESSDATYHQELLILRNDGTKKAPRCHCIYVTKNSVSRGEWMLVGNIVHCGLSGIRADNTHEIAGLYLTHLSGRELLSGFLAGTGTDLQIPVAMPLVAVRVPNASASVLELGDLGDEAILRAFRAVEADLSGISKKLHQILASQMEPLVFDATESHPKLRQAFGGGRLMVDPKFLDFCKSTIS